MAVSQSLLNQVQDLYIAFYDRPADLGGLNYWAGVVANDYNGNVQGILQDFAQSQESQNLYGTITSSNVGTVINQIYYDLFNRGADPTGLQYWTNAYNTYHMSAGELAYDILGGAQGTDTTTIYNKLQAANVFTQTMANNYTSALIPTANSFINAVTATTDLTQITPSSVSSYTQSFQTSTYNLTTGVDTLVGSNSVNDVFSGTYATWTPGDSITGAQGANNTLNLTDDRGTSADSVQPTSLWNLNPANSSVSGVQNVNVASQTAVSIDTTKWTGVTNLTIAASDAWNVNNGSSYNASSTVIAAPTTNINFTDSNLFNDALANNNNETITGGQNVTINESGVNYASGNGIVVNGLNGTQSVSVTQSLAATTDTYAPVTITDFNSVGGNNYPGVTPTTPSLGTITTVSLDGLQDNTNTNTDAATITDNNLQTLTVNDASSTNAATVQITDNPAISGVPTALTLNVSNDGNTTTPVITTIEESNSNNKGQYTTLNVVTGAKSSNITLTGFNALTTLNVSGSSTLTLSGLTQTTPVLSTVAISGAAGFTSLASSGVAVLPASLTSITDSSSGVVNVWLPTNATNTNTTTASFDGSTATGQEIVTITQPVSASIKGGTATNNELVISPSANFTTDTPVKGATAISSFGTGAISGFDVLGINDSSTTGNNFDIAALGKQLGSGFNNTVDLQQVASGLADTLYNLANNSTLQFDSVNNSYGTINAIFAGTSGATDTANVVFNHALSDTSSANDISISALQFNDSATPTANGIGTLNITDTVVPSSGVLSDTITSLTDNSLTTLNINSNNNFEIGTLNDSTTSPVSINLSGAGQFILANTGSTPAFGSSITSITSGSGLSTSAPTLTITDNSTNANASIFNISDNSLNTLNLAGSHYINIDNLNESTISGAGVASLTIQDNSTNTVTLINPSLTALNSVSAGLNNPDSILTLTDNNLTSLTFSGSHSFTIGTLTDDYFTATPPSTTNLTITNSNATALDTIQSLSLGTITVPFTLTLTGNVGLGVSGTAASITDNTAATSALATGFTLAALQDNANINLTLIDTPTSSVSSTTVNNIIQVGTGTNVITLIDANGTDVTSITDTITFADNSTVFNGGSSPAHLTAVALVSSLNPFTISAPSTTHTVAFDFSYVPTSTTFSFDNTPITLTQTDTSLAAALADAQSHLPTAYNGGFFVWGTNTYFFADSTTGHQAIIELVGVTGLSSSTVAQANHQVVVS